MQALSKSTRLFATPIIFGTTNYQPPTSKPPRHSKVIQERKLIDDIVCGTVYVENILVVIDIGEGETELQRVPLAQKELLLGAEVETVIARQACIVEIGEEEIDILVVGDIIVVDTRWIVMGIVCLSLRERESRAEVPAEIHLP